MATSAIATKSAPEFPAPPVPLYTQFLEVAVPHGSGATRAYRGWIRPFSDDETAKRVLRAIEADESLLVSEGRLDFLGAHLQKHGFEDYLIDMAVPCEVIVLEFPGGKHHTAYLINPAQEPYYSGNSHTWWRRKKLSIEGKEVPELCIYSGNLFQYDPALDRLTQFLNQLSTYLAKHLIYLRTRMLYSDMPDGSSRLMRVRKPWEPVKKSVLKLVKRVRWKGYWSGKAAPNGPEQHLRTLDPNKECWCNVGKLYKDCHMPDEQQQISKLTEDPA